MEIRRTAGSDPKARELIRRTFRQFEAPEYSEEGIRSFEAFIDDVQGMDTLDCFGAFEGEELLGIIAAREHMSHVCLFFVREESQGRGVGKKLWNHLLSESEAKRVTVHASPYAVGIYERLGFFPLSEERLTDGIRYTPMEYRRNSG